jgi:hypothetical protein
MSEFCMSINENLKASNSCMLLTELTGGHALKNKFGF